MKSNKRRFYTRKPHRLRSGQERERRGSRASAALRRRIEDLFEGFALAGEGLLSAESDGLGLYFGEFFKECAEGGSAVAANNAADLSDLR